MTIDINCDLGEGFNNEAQLMPYLSSCSIACGGHAGSLETMEEVVSLAKQYQVKVGAHPSFPDVLNFGRKIIEMPEEELKNTLISQILSLKSIVEAKGLKLYHVKAHGALYNLSAKNETIAQLMVDVVKQIDDSLVLYVPFNSVMAQTARQHHVNILYEGFADRNYNTDFSLVSRDKANAIISDSEAIFDHVFRMISNQKVKTISGVEVPIKVDTICVHGDHKNVVQNLRYLSQRLSDKNIKIS